ncbi:MAG: hypothetical protein ACTSUE_18190 [Promethearchaeota archaeon]
MKNLKIHPEFTPVTLITEKDLNILGTKIKTHTREIHNIFGRSLEAGLVISAFSSQSPL